MAINAQHARLTMESIDGNILAPATADTQTSRKPNWNLSGPALPVHVFHLDLGTTSITPTSWVNAATRRLRSVRRGVAAFSDTQGQAMSPREPRQDMSNAKDLK